MRPTTEAVPSGKDRYACKLKAYQMKIKKVVISNFNKKTYITLIHQHKTERTKKLSSRHGMKYPNLLKTIEKYVFLTGPNHYNLQVGELTNMARYSKLEIGRKNKSHS